MRILLDALQAGNQSGTGTYALALARTLPQSLPAAEVAAVYPEHLSDSFAAMPLSERYPCSVAGFPTGTIARSIQMRRAAQRFKPDIVHYPASFARLTGRSGASSAKMIVTIHDLSFLRHPEWFERRRAIYYRMAIRPTVRNADLLLADSQATADDLQSLLGVPPDKIVVTHLGVDEGFAPAPSTAIEAVRKRLRLPRKFFLYLGTIEPRKNLPRVIAAYDEIAAGCDLDLVIAGREGWRTGETRAAWERSPSKSRIHFPGFVSSAEMCALLSAAEVFVWPSLWEGFGLPPLEAMACGTPVITSSTSSLPEVVGDAGLTVNPEDTGAIAHAMRTLVNDVALRARLRDAGLARAREFTWKRTAELTARAYERALGG